MKQTWRHLLFAHWPVPAERLRALIPPGLEVDTYGGTAWVGVVPFTMTGIRFRCCPPVPGISAFHEVNVRSYVTHCGRPGVWFFSLDAASRLNVRAARKLYRLPYYFARMSLQKSGDEIQYRSVRRDCHGASAILDVRYGPTGAPFQARAGTLEEWLTERYCLYACNRGEEIWRGEIHHAPWRLEPAWAEWKVNSLAAASGITLPDASPLLHFSRCQETVVWGLEKAAHAAVLRDP